MPPHIAPNQPEQLIIAKKGKVAMKSLIVASLLLISINSSPCFAGSFGGPETLFRQDVGAFAGARLRIRLGGKNDGHVRAGLSFAPITRTETMDGRAAVRYSEGIEFGFNGDNPAGLSLGGRPLNRLTSHPGVKIDKRGAKGISTLGTVGIGAGVILIAGAAYVAVLSRGCYECDD